VNRRKFIAGLAAAPVIGFGVTMPLAPVQHPLLLEAVLKFQKASTAELLPLACSFRQTKEIFAANVFNARRA
jgi:hypothetical protein